MKKLFNYLCVLLFILAAHGPIYAQDFTVTIPLTDNCAHLIKPIKAGGTHQFQINVKNNRSDTCTVSIDKNAMGTVSSWVSIDNNSQQIFPSQSVNFQLTINVPASAEDIDYFMFLYFDAYDKSYVNHSFGYYTQTIIVDNSDPSPPTFTLSQTSTTILVNSWDSWDERSNTYTMWNSSAGYGGIKTYKVDIKNPDGTIVKSITKDFADDDDYTFTNLNPNTNYTACVTAIDLVGNTKTTEKSAITAAAKPMDLTFSNITYIGASLSWSASVGATGYNVYKVTGSTNTKLNSSPITGNSYNIIDLDPNTPYEFNVIALSNVGPSDRSDNAPITTLALPKIAGSSNICSGTYTYSIRNLVSGYTLSWDNSSNISMQSATGSLATFTKVWDGEGWIDASITAPNSRNLELVRKEIYAGHPLLDASEIIFSNWEGVSYYLCTSHAGNQFEVPSDGFDYLEVKLTNINNTQIIDQFYCYSNTGSLDYSQLSPSYYLFWVRGYNDCGWGDWYETEIEFVDCSTRGSMFYIEIFPNPTKTEATIELKRYDKKEVAEDIEWEFEVFDMGQNLKLKSNKTRGKKHKILSQNLERGIYIVRAKINNELITSKLIVEK